MKIICFAETTPALLAGAKTVTRREWRRGYAETFNADELVQAWDKSPRNGGKKVATIRLTQTPYLEVAADIPHDDYIHEGFEYMDLHGLTLFGGKRPLEVFDAWRNDENTNLWVVRFMLVGVPNA